MLLRIVHCMHQNLLTKYALLFLLHWNISATDQHFNVGLESALHETIAFAQRPAQTKTLDAKDWTFIVYVAADNDLRTFAAKNIKQMAQIGSNQHINIVVQLDIRITGNKKITRRYYIERSRILHVNSEDPDSQSMDSGDPRTLISCCKWAIEDYPAENYALILWNHGTGIIDPETNRIFNAADLFTYNPAINKLELDRTIGFLDFIHDKERDRGMCWDETTGNYLTNQKMDFALREITTRFLHGEKFEILGFDACLMSMLEVANIAKKYAKIMVASQEVELGRGPDYELVLKPFLYNTLEPREFARHMVAMYEETFNRITNDYTQSALDLELVDDLENNVHEVAELLIECLRKQSGATIKNALRAARSRLSCTYFEEPSYLDLHHLWDNILSNLKHFSFNDAYEGDRLRTELRGKLEEGKKLIHEVVIANRVGKNLSLAKGISIYFPERRIHSSYKKATFAAHNNWYPFLIEYLLLA